MDSKIKLIADSFGRDRVKLNEPIKDFTTLKVGGPAALFFIAFSQQEVIKIVSICHQLNIPFIFFGSGSKIMVSDLGFKGVAIKNRTKQIKVLSVKGKVTKIGIGVEEALVEVESGVSINKLVEFLDNQGLASEEFRDLPGSIGGNIFINRSIQDKTESLKVINSSSKIENIPIKKLSLNDHIILTTVLKIRSKLI